jgi:ABC-type branched-subunit amino acid transport system ATPase component
VGEVESFEIALFHDNARMALEIAHRGYVFKIGGIFL